MSTATTRNTTSENAKPPVTKLRIGLLSANIWERTGDKGTFHSVSFEKGYRDSEGRWKSGHSFDAADLLALAKLADQAHTRILELRNGDE